MNNKNLFVLFTSLIALNSCHYNKGKNNGQEISFAKQAIMDKYPEVPKDELVTNTDSLTTAVYNELKDRYKKSLNELNTSVTANGAKLIITFLTPEVGQSSTPGQKIGLNYIETICKEMNIPFYDLTTNIAKMDPLVVTQMPKDGHWSKEGAKIVANEVKPIIDLYATAKCTATFADAKAHTIYGDLTPNEKSIKDGGKNIPYKVNVNAQGLRMDKDVESTKSKQRILFMGDSEMFFPFLDNENTGTALLQNMYPDKEILNACMWGYTINDYVSLYNEKAKYAQPDVVIIETNGNDILDFYFSQRNKLSRNQDPVSPSDNEMKYYETKYAKK